MSLAKGGVVSELIPFFDECLPVSGILPRVREELETALTRIPQDSPEYEKLHRIDSILSGVFRKTLLSALSQTIGYATECSEDFPNSLRRLHSLIKHLEF